MSLEETYAKIVNDPWEFLKIVRTLDEVDRENPIKYFPVDLEYLYLYVRLWQKNPLIAVPKTRRMKMSWTNIALHLWDTMFREGRNAAFVSKKEDDSDALVKRAEFIYDHLDENVLPRELLPRKVSKFCTLDFPEINSKISGYPSGADQLRQFTFSSILGDESAFWPDAQEMYKGSFPTIEGGGRLTMISSAAPGFFKKLVFDQLDSEKDHNVDIEQNMAIRREAMQGVEVWKNPKNKFLVVQLHYTADPHKRTEEWKRTVRDSMPLRDFLQEYEIHWDSFVGLPVYGDYEHSVHACKKPMEPIIGLPLLRGWDFGMHSACVIGQLQENKLVILREFTELNMGAEQFSERVLKQCSVLYPAWASTKNDWVDIIDPAGLNRDVTTAGSCARILDSKGLTVHTGELRFEDRRKAVEKFLIRRDGLVIDASQCPVLVRGFNGGYRYPDSVLDREPKEIRPIKDEHSHPHDCLQYICSRISTLRRTPNLKIPVLTYFEGARM